MKDRVLPPGYRFHIIKTTLTEVRVVLSDLPHDRLIKELDGTSGLPFPTGVSPVSLVSRSVQRLLDTDVLPMTQPAEQIVACMVNRRDYEPPTVTPGDGMVLVPLEVFDMIRERMTVENTISDHPTTPCPSCGCRLGDTGVSAEYLRCGVTDQRVAYVMSVECNRCGMTVSPSDIDAEDGSK